MQKFIFQISYLIILLYFWILKKTIKINYHNFNDLYEELNLNKTIVIGCAHHTLLPCLLAAQGEKAWFLVSKSTDGELVAKILAKQGYNLIRGSSHRGAIGALRSILSIIEQNLGGAICLAVDGPKGPPFIPKAGFAICIMKSKSNSYLFWLKNKTNKLRTKLYFRIKSWDKMLIPLPFAEFDIIAEKIVLDNKNMTEKDIINYVKQKMFDIYMN